MIEKQSYERKENGAIYELFCEDFQNFCRHSRKQIWNFICTSEEVINLYGISFYIIFAIVKVEIYANFTIAVVIFKNLISTCF